jgi:N-methylhydantoinase B
MTNSWNTPIEAFEHEYPLRVRAYGIRGGSGGAGKQAGGDGIVRELEFLENADVTILSDRRKRGPYGLQGGENGAPGRGGVLTDGGYKELPSKTRVTIRRGERLRIETPGGGGWGTVLVSDHD